MGRWAQETAVSPSVSPEPLVRNRLLIDWEKNEKIYSSEAAVVISY